MGLDSQWLEIFRAGDYGEKGSYGPAEIAQIAANYTPDLHEAPVTVGHPSTDAPAYGWVEALRAKGDVLEAKLKQVHENLRDWVNAGRFKKWSVALYKDLAGRGLYLRHLGFLGAQPPEVKGLKPVFSDEDFAEYVEIGLEEPAGGKRYSELEMLMHVNATRDAVRAAMLRDLQNQQNGAKRRAEALVFAERLKPHARQIPAFAAPGLVEFIEGLSREPTVEFGEGESKQTKSQFEVFVDFTEALPKILAFSQGRRSLSVSRTIGQA
jgi:hypothetical protein